MNLPHWAPDESLSWVVASFRVLTTNMFIIYSFGPLTFNIFIIYSFELMTSNIFTASGSGQPPYIYSNFLVGLKIRPTKTRIFHKINKVLRLI
jgi:hypothetical protein